MLFTDLMVNVFANVFGALSTIMPDLLAVAPANNTPNGWKAMGDGIGAGLAGIGVLGAGIGQGAAAQGACMAIGRNPEVASKISSTMIIGAGIAESGAIYALVIAILLVFVA